MARNKPAIGSKAFAWAWGKLPQLVAIAFWMVVSACVGYTLGVYYGLFTFGGLVVGFGIVWLFGILTKRSVKEDVLDTFHEYKKSTDVIIARRERIRSTQDVVCSFSQLLEFGLRSPKNMNLLIDAANEHKLSGGESKIPKLVDDE